MSITMAATFLWMKADASLFPGIDTRHVHNYGCDFPLDEGGCISVSRYRHQACPQLLGLSNYGCDFPLDEGGCISVSRYRQQACFPLDEGGCISVSRYRHQACP